ncbi:hypothetical protein D3C71_2143960 [compost metagenome]
MRFIGADISGGRRIEAGSDRQPQHRTKQQDQPQSFASHGDDSSSFCGSGASAVWIAGNVIVTVVPSSSSLSNARPNSRP